VLVGTEAELDVEITMGVRAMVEDVRMELDLVLVPRLTVEIVLGNASGFPNPRPRQETN
jgi:hypothetical protein